MYKRQAYEVYSKDEYWVKQEDGSFIAGCTDPDAKKPLGALAKLYEAGAIDHECAVKEQSKEEELIASGKIGIYIGYFYSPLGVMKDSVANVGADWIAVPKMCIRDSRCTGWNWAKREKAVLFISPGAWGWQKKPWRQPGLSLIHIY